MLKNTTLGLAALVLLIQFSACTKVENAENANSVLLPVSETAQVIDQSGHLPHSATSLDLAMESMSETLAPEDEELVMGKSVKDLGEIGNRIQAMTEFKLFCKFETSLSLMDEGKHCDLLDWKHGYSEWKEISENVGENGHFELPEPTAQDRSTFPVVSLASLKAAYTQHCSDHWTAIIPDLKGPNEYPSGIGISKALLRLEGKDKGGKVVKEFYNMEILMGC